MAAAPSPTRREARRLGRREAILDIAQASFVEAGYAGTTMSGIAARLGGSKATLWSYFPSKQALFAATVARFAGRFRAELLPILDPAAPVEAALTRACGEFIARITSPQSIALYRLVAGETARFPEIGRIYFDAAPGETRRLLAAYLREALPGVDAEEAAQVLTGLCMSGSHMRRLLGAEPPGAETIGADVALAMNAFRRLYL